MIDVEQATPESTLASPNRNRRKWQNFVLKPKYQMKYTWHQMFGGLVFFGFTAFLVNIKGAQIDALMAATRVMDLTTQAQINRIYTESTMVFMVGFAAYIFYSCTLVMIASHRISGPMIAIVDTIQQLTKGNYGYKRSLRKNDELVPIQQQLETLSDALEDKAKGPTK